MHTRKKNIVKAIKLILTGVDLYNRNPNFRHKLCKQIYGVLRANNIEMLFTVINDELYVSSYDIKELRRDGN
jgi:hypothetical protein